MSAVSLREFLRTMHAAPDRGVRHLWPGIPPISLKQLLKLLPRDIYPGLARLENRDVLSFDSDNAQGVAYGDNNIWFLSTTNRVFKYSMEGDDFYNPTRWTRLQAINLGDILSALRPNPGKFDHIGGICYSKGVLFVPIQLSDNPPHLLVSMTRNLQMLGYTRLDNDIRAAWCAVNPWNGFLYMDSSSQSSFLKAFDVSGHFDRLSHPEHWGEPVDMVEKGAPFYFLDQHGAPETADGIQGADYSPTGRLYLTPCSENWDASYNNYLRVYDVRTGIRLGDRKYDFSGLYDEIEGISICSPDVMYISVYLNLSNEFHLYAFRYPTNDPL